MIESATPCTPDQPSSANNKARVVRVHMGMVCRGIGEVTIFKLESHLCSDSCILGRECKLLLPLLALRGGGDLGHARGK